MKATLFFQNNILKRYRHTCRDALITLFLGISEPNYELKNDSALNCLPNELFPDQNRRHFAHCGGHHLELCQNFGHSRCPIHGAFFGDTLHH